MAQQDQRGMLSHAQKEGFNEGLLQGKQLGHTEGLSEGLLQGEQLGHTKGLAQGKQEGLAEGLRTAIWAVAELLGIEKTEEREAALRLQSEAQLKDFLEQLKQSRSWNESPAKGAKSRRPA
jgi:hypothetical protein